MSVEDPNLTAELAHQAELRGEELTEEVRHLAHPAILDELAQLTDAESQLARLKDQREALTDQSEILRQEIRKKYREQQAKKFTDIDWKRVLCGMTGQQHKISFADAVAYYIEQPNAQKEHEVRKFVTEQAEKQKLTPIMPEESTLLCWLVKVEYLGNAGEQPVLSTNLAKKLQQIRALSAPMLVKISDECRALGTYLSVVLEEELGNS